MTREILPVIFKIVDSRWSGPIVLWFLVIKGFIIQNSFDFSRIDAKSTSPAFQIDWFRARDAMRALDLFEKVGNH